jgi:hypothetical protein
MARSRKDNRDGRPYIVTLYAELNVKRSNELPALIVRNPPFAIPISK